MNFHVLVALSFKNYVYLYGNKIENSQGDVFSQLVKLQWLWVKSRLYKWFKWTFPSTTPLLPLSLVQVIFPSFRALYPLRLVLVCLPFKKTESFMDVTEGKYDLFVFHNFISAKFSSG